MGMRRGGNIPPENQIQGRGGTRMLKFEVTGSGEFIMDYVQPWENQPIDISQLLLESDKD